MSISTREELQIDGALRAFDQLGELGPKLVMNELRSLATDQMHAAQSKAPGSLRFGWRIDEMSDPATNDTFGFAVLSEDKAKHGEKPVARWTNYGTGDKADKRKIRDGNESFLGQRPQRFLRPVSKARKEKAVLNALTRAARRSGFEQT